MRKDYLKTLYLIPYTLYLVFLLCSCGQETEKIPSDILSKEKMAQVITDIHIAEAETHLLTFPDSSSNEKISFLKIFEKHHITKEQYETSLSFYIDHPEMLNEIYQKVLNELSKMQGKASGR